MNVVIVDADTHLNVALSDIAPFVEQPWRSHLELSPGKSLLPYLVGDQTVGGRIQRPMEAVGGRPAVGAQLSVVFPDQLLGIDLHPNPRFQTAIASGYARWLTEVYLPRHPEARGMLYLPLSSPDAAIAVVERFGRHPAIVGGFVTNAPSARIHDNRFVGVYAALQDLGLALAFHPIAVWAHPPFRIFDRFLPVWAVGHPFSQSVHLINWVLHAMPDRFPRLRCIFLEAGVAWLMFVAHRLDEEFMKRPSEAPLLRERPSHYVRRCFFSTQPLDQLSDPAYLEPMMRLVGCEQLVFASNMPAWDFDLPAVIEDLPFLTAEERSSILGGNAVRLFDLSDPSTEGADRC